MGRPIGPRKVQRYSVEFKLTAVKLSGMPGVQVQTAANALDIHPSPSSRLATSFGKGDGQSRLVLRSGVGVDAPTGWRSPNHGGRHGGHADSE
jgi:transposase